MTLEELQAKVSDLEAEREAVNSKNKELLSELRKVKASNKEVDIDKHFQLAEDFENLKAEHEKLIKVSKLDAEKLTKSLSDKDSALQRYLIDDGLSTNLAKMGVKPEFMDASKALLRQKAQLKDEGGEYKAYLGDKSLSDGIAEWITTDGKHFIAGKDSQGGGANGSGSTGKGNIDLTGMSATEVMKMGRKTQ